MLYVFYSCLYWCLREIKRARGATRGSCCLFACDLVNSLIASEYFAFVSLHGVCIFNLVGQKRWIVEETAEKLNNLINLRPPAVLSTI